MSRAVRLPEIDILRGFALLGILIMNMPGFSYSQFAEADGSHLWVRPVDQWSENLRDMLCWLRYLAKSLRGAIAIPTGRPGV